MIMHSARKKVLVFRELSADQLARIESLHDVTIANPQIPEQLAAFHAALVSAHGLIGSRVPIDESTLDLASNLEVISSISVGVDNYPLEALRARGIMLCHTPGVLTETTADTLFALIMATSRRLVELALHVRDGRWNCNIGEDKFGWDVHGKTLGILGFGRIGQALARRAALGFDMPVLYTSRRDVVLPALAGKASRVSMVELLKAADIVALTLPLSDETRGLIGRREFDLMKPGAILINGARGAIVQEDALLDALDRGHLRAAGLDVFASEPLPLDSAIRCHPRITALPHIGSATHETRRAMAELATTNLLQALSGVPPVAQYRYGPR
jgi:phosphogluconate 2-dehydrogenase